MSFSEDNTVNKSPGLLSRFWSKILLFLGIVVSYIRSIKNPLSVFTKTKNPWEGRRYQESRSESLQWAQQHISSCQINNFTSSWVDGIGLCELVQSLVPGSCPRYDLLKPSQGLNNLVLALKLVERHLGVRPVLKPEQITLGSPDFDAAMRYYISLIRDAAEKNGHKSWERTHCKKTVRMDKIEEETVDSFPCTAKGSGLLIGALKKCSKFTLFLKQTRNINIYIEIRGPNDDIAIEKITNTLPRRLSHLINQQDIEQLNASLYGNNLITPNSSKLIEDKLKTTKIVLDYQFKTENQLLINYMPRSIGRHIIIIKWHAEHIPGSPFIINVTEFFEEGNQSSCVQRKSSSIIDAEDIETLKSKIIKPEVGLGNRVRHVTRRRILKRVIKTENGDIVLSDISKGIELPAIILDKSISLDVSQEEDMNKKTTSDSLQEKESPTKESSPEVITSCTVPAQPSTKESSPEVIPSYTVKESSPEVIPSYTVSLQSSTKESHPEVITSHTVSPQSSLSSEKTSFESATSSMLSSSNLSESLTSSEISQNSIDKCLDVAMSFRENITSSDKNLNCSIREKIDNFSDLMLHTLMKEVIAYIQNRSHFIKIMNSYINDEKSKLETNSLSQIVKESLLRTKKRHQKKSPQLTSSSISKKTLNPPTKLELGTGSTKLLESNSNTNLIDDTQMNNSSEQIVSENLNSNSSRKARLKYSDRRKKFQMSHSLPSLFHSWQPFELSLSDDDTTYHTEHKKLKAQKRFSLPTAHLISQESNPDYAQKNEMSLLPLKELDKLSNEQDVNNRQAKSEIQNDLKQSPILPIHYEDKSTQVHWHEIKKTVQNSSNDVLENNMKWMRVPLSFERCGKKKGDAFDLNNLFRTSRENSFDSSIMRNSFIDTSLPLVLRSGNKEILIDRDTKNKFKSHNRKRKKLKKHNCFQENNSEDKLFLRFIQNKKNTMNLGEKNKITQNVITLGNRDETPLCKRYKYCAFDLQSIPSDVKTEQQLNCESFPNNKILDKCKSGSDLCEWSFNTRDSSISSVTTEQTTESTNSLEEPIDTYKKMQYLTTSQCVSETLKLKKKLRKQKLIADYSSFAPSTENKLNIIQQLHRLKNNGASTNKCLFYDYTDPNIQDLCNFNNDGSYSLDEQSSTDISDVASELPVNSHKLGIIPDYVSFFMGHDYVSFTGLLDTSGINQITWDIDNDNFCYTDTDPEDMEDSEDTHGNLPKPERCQAIGSGLSYGQIGVKNNFQVKTQFAGNGYLTVGIHGPSANSTSETTVLYTGDNLYEIIYEVTQPGYYIIKIKWADIHIPDSPFICKVTL